MPVTHEPWLVALSLVVAIQGAYVGLSLAVQVGGAIGARQRWLLAGAALSLGVAIWAMHFVAMLAARLPFPVDYLVFPTLLSFLVCVLVVGAAVFAVSAGPLTTPRLLAAAVFMGLGIVSMHYTGMTALHASAHMTHSPLLVAAGVAIAIATSGVALRLATPNRPAAALRFGDRAGLRHRRHALHGDGGGHHLPASGVGAFRSGALRRSPRHRRRDRRLRRVRPLSPHPGSRACRIA